jgi:hypothetical protein
MKLLHTAALMSKIVMARLKSTDMLIYIPRKRERSKCMVMRHQSNFCGAQATEVTSLECGIFSDNILPPSTKSGLLAIKDLVSGPSESCCL